MIRRPGVDALAAMVIGAVLYELVTGGAELAVDAVKRWRDQAGLPLGRVPGLSMLGQCGVPLYEGNGTTGHVHCTRPAGHLEEHR